MRTSRRNTTVFAVVLWLQGSIGNEGPLAAQSTLLTFDPCTQCRLDVTYGVTLGEDGNSVIGRFTEAVRLEDGRLAVVFTNVDHEFTVFSADGAEWARVGRRGEAPGEYEWIKWLEAAGGNLHVFDPFQRRITVLGRDFEVVRDFQFRGQATLLDAAVLADSLYVINAWIPTRERAGFVLHTFGPEGRLIASFDEMTEAHPLGTHEDQMGILRVLEASSRDGLFWAANRNRYELDLWNARTGRRITRFVRDVEWFPGHGPSYPLHPSKPPPPIIVDVHENDGLLWVLMYRPTKQWAEHVIPRKPSQHPELGEYVMDGRPGAMERVVEVIDPEAGRVLHQSVLREPWVRFLEDGEVVLRHSDELGRTVIRTAQVRLVR